jgi:hypothetical protein
VSARGARCLHDLPAANFLPLVAGEIAHGLDCQGFALTPYARAYVHRGGLVTVRMVWRKRHTVDSVVMMLRLRGQMPEMVVDALMAALEPGMVADAAG